MFPNAANDMAIFKTWHERDGIVAAVTGSFSGAISSATVMTSAGNLPNTAADGHIFHITHSNGAGANIGREVITTAGNNNALTCANAGWTNEDPVAYTYATYYTYVCMKLMAGASDASPVQKDWGDRAFEFKNLSLETLTAGAVLHVHIW